MDNGLWRSADNRGADNRGLTVLFQRAFIGGLLA